MVATQGKKNDRETGMGNSKSSGDASEIVLWGVGTARTVRPLWVAEELGLSYNLRPIGSRTGETLTDEYTHLNRKQKIPFLVDGLVHLSESVVICNYLLEAYSNGSIWAPQSLLERSKVNEWVCYIFGEIDETGLYVMRRHRDLAPVYGEAPAAVQSSADYVRRHLDVVSEHLKGREYLMEHYTFADIMLITCLDWAEFYEIELSPTLVGYSEKIRQRPAYQKAMAINFAGMQILQKR